MLRVVVYWGPRDHINIRISHSGSKAQFKGIPETLFWRILMFIWSFGALYIEVLKSPAAYCNCRPQVGDEWKEVRSSQTHGWLSNLWSLLGCLIQ